MPARRCMVMAILMGLLTAACGSVADPSGHATPPSPSARTSASAPATPAASPSGRPGLSLVVVGDSILDNDPENCPGCTSFADLYADAIADATGKAVTVRDLAESRNLQVTDLLLELDNDPTRISALTGADVIVVGIAHNDVPWNRDDDACDGPFTKNPDWSKYTDACLTAEVDKFTPRYEEVYQRIAALRAGKPTILRTVNRYNDWIGWPGHDLSLDGAAWTATVVSVWNHMICTAAEAHGFLCADLGTRFNGEDGFEPSGDLLGEDYTHPSERGQAAIAEVLIDLGLAPLAP